ncbi:MAG: rhamnogalacturonan acetylesterase [Paludibacteraceae bacterium]|nr:rhamnogalacturonan acetylesterase [Paludibacteraceae bacterium]
MKRLGIIVFVICCFSTAIFTPADAAKRRVFTIGDSTMSDYKPAATPKRGWGMYLQAFFNPDSVEVVNCGKSGASTRTFYETANLWPSVKKQFHTGDYLIIQFAHNDEKCKGEDVYVQNAKLRAEGKDTLSDLRGTEPNTTYKEYLFKFVNEAREYGITPILMSPLCRAYFKEGKINDEGRHKLAENKDYVKSMQQVAADMWVPFLDMTAASQEFLERQGKDYCMAHYFNCGDKTHTSAEGGMMVATLAYNLISQEPLLQEMQAWMDFPSKEEYDTYAQRIEEKGRQAAFEAKGTPFNIPCSVFGVQNMKKHKNGYAPTDCLWPAGEIDEVANRYIEYTIAAEPKKGLVIETITLSVRAKGGSGMNMHINYGFGDQFSGVTTIYENTALPKNKKVTITLNQPVLVPAGQIIHLRILPWYDSNGKPQKGKFLQLGELQITGKRLN